MLFSSISFIYYFLPIVLFFYYLVGKRVKNLILLLASLLFYFLGEPIYTLLLIFSSLVDYSHSLVIERYRGTRKAKVALVSSIIINLAMLGFFKYADFFIENVNTLFSLSISKLNLSLPIGISFFTFQTMSYTIDVYRNEAKAQKNPITIATYITLFPQLIAGPIVRYKTLAEELSNRRHSFDQFAYGVKRFILGLAKKVLLANQLGELALIASTSKDTSTLFYWIAAISFSLQIYFDFSGYSDMAIGLGRMFGFHFLENFNYPYISRSITEFWSRWHISLGSWFKDYVYIPLGGNRGSKLKWYRNIALVWLLTGLWHGASWNFVFWGLYFGLILVLEKRCLLAWLDRIPSVFRHFYVLLLVVISFVIFNNENMSEMKHQFMGMFYLDRGPLLSSEALYYLNSYKLVLLLAIIGATPHVKNLFTKLQDTKKVGLVLHLLEGPVYLLLLLIITGYLVDASFNPFLYFRF